MLNDDRNYSAPEDVFGPDNDDRTVWGYPLVLADWQSWYVGHAPWRRAGETSADYAARVAPAFPDYSTEEIARWFDHASVFPA